MEVLVHPQLGLLCGAALPAVFFLLRKTYVLRENIPAWVIPRQGTPANGCRMSKRTSTKIVHSMVPAFISTINVIL